MPRSRYWDETIQDFRVVESSYDPLVGETNLAVQANTLIGPFTPNAGDDVVPSRLEVSFSVSGILSIVRNGVEEKLNGGQPLAANTLYAFDVSLWPGRTYGLKHSAASTGQIYWYWRTE